MVGDVKQSFETASKAEMFVPYAQYPDPILAGMYLSPVLVVRTSGAAGSVSPSLRTALHELDPEQPFVNLRTMQAQIDGTTAQPRLQTTLLVVFAILAATLAVVGVYGVVSYAVLQRVPEIGVRLALGATPSQVVGLVVREGTTLLAGGLGLGLVAAALASRALQRFLFEVQGLDPLTWWRRPRSSGSRRSARATSRPDGRRGSRRSRPSGADRRRTPLVARRIGPGLR